MTRLVAAVTLIALLSGCAGAGDAAAPDRGAGGGPTSSTPAAQLVATPSNPYVEPTDVATPGTGKGGAVKAGDAEESYALTNGKAKPPAGTDPKKWAPLVTRISTTCLDRGEEMVAIAETEPNSGVGFAVGYSDPPEGEEGVVPDYTYFDRETNVTGTMRWAFVIRPGVPYGRAVLKVVVSAPDGRGAFDTLYFKVSSTCP